MNQTLSPDVLSAARQLGQTTDNRESTLQFLKGIKQYPDLFEAFAKSMVMEIEDSAGGGDDPDCDRLMDRTSGLLIKYKIPFLWDAGPEAKWRPGNVQFMHFAVMRLLE